MQYTTYFEMGGQIVESYVEPVASPRPAANPLLELAKDQGLSKRDAESLNRALKEDTGIDGMRISQAAGS